MIIEVLLLVLGLIALVKGADFLVGGASSVAKKFNISDLSIGLTVVSFGTSMPELIVNVMSSTKGYSDIAFGNVLGSNNFNTLLVLGIVGLFRPFPIQRSTIRFEIPMFIFSTLLLLILVSDSFFINTDFNFLSRLDASILLACFVAFIYQVYRTRNHTINDVSSTVKIYKTYISVGLVIVGLIMLSVGGELTVINAVHIARRFTISERTIGLTIIAMGTSLPELATSLVAVHKKNMGIALGNVIGSNVFNICLVLGITGLINPMKYNNEINFDIYVSLAASLLLLIFMFTLKKRNIDRQEALILLVGYILYTTTLIYSEASP